MKFIVENWFVIVAIAAVGGSIGYAIYSFVKMPSDKQLNKVREWLLYAVTKAEKELGWKAENGIREMCEDSWRWQSQNPNGYED